MSSEPAAAAAAAASVPASPPTRLVITEVASVVGYKLKKEQQKSILELVSGKDVFVCLPTGYGKSLSCHMFLTGFVLYNSVPQNRTSGLTKTI